jgi:hypothetical protein
VDRLHAKTVSKDPPGSCVPQEPHLDDLQRSIPLATTLAFMGYRVGGVVMGAAGIHMYVLIFESGGE